MKYLARTDIDSYVEIQMDVAVLFFEFRFED